MGPEHRQWLGSGLMWIIPLIFLVVFLFFIRSVFEQRGSMGRGSHSDNASNQESAQEILNKRYARGEITKEEYEEMKRTLGKGPS